MTTITIVVCDFCGDQERSDQPARHWGERNKVVKWEMPVDGINGGREAPTLCRDCRIAVSQAITNVKLKRAGNAP